MDAINIRPATPHDANEAVPLIFSSGPDAFNYVFKTDRYSAEEFLEFAFIRKGGEFSFDNHFVLELDKSVIGIGSVFTDRQGAKFTIKDFIKIVQFYNWRVLPVLLRGLKIEQIIRLPKKGEISIAHFAIAPPHHGRGYGQKIIEFMMNQADINSESTFILDVSERNPRAKSLYERMGFTDEKLVESSLKSNHGFVVNHYRMVKIPI